MYIYIYIYIYIFAVYANIVYHQDGQFKSQRQQSKYTLFFIFIYIHYFHYIAISLHLDRFRYIWYKRKGETNHLCGVPVFARWRRDTQVCTEGTGQKTNETRESLFSLGKNTGSPEMFLILTLFSTLTINISIGGRYRTFPSAVPCDTSHSRLVSGP